MIIFYFFHILRALHRIMKAGVLIIFSCLLTILLLLLSDFFERRVVLSPTAQQVVPKVIVTLGHGSGVVVGDRIVLTAAHVVEDVKGELILSSRDMEVKGTIAFLDKEYDIALIQTKDIYPIHATISCRELPVGEKIWALGHPLQEKYVYTFGYIASEPRTSSVWKKTQLANITVGFGMSGGPVFSIENSLAGIVVGTYAGFMSPTGTLSFLVPMSAICEYFNTSSNMKNSIRIE